MPSEAAAVSNGPNGTVTDYDYSADGDASASAVSPSEPAQNRAAAPAGAQSVQNSGTQYGTSSQTADDKLHVVMDHLVQLGVGEEALAQLQQMIDRVVQNGADPNQVADALVGVLQDAEEQCVTDPNQILQTMVETLEQIDLATADSKFQMVFEHLANLGVDNDTLEQLQQSIDQVVQNGADPNQLADAMIQQLQGADELMQALEQILQEAAEASGQGEPQAAEASAQVDPQAAEASAHVEPQAAQASASA